MISFSPSENWLIVGRNQPCVGTLATFNLYNLHGEDKLEPQVLEIAAIVNKPETNIRLSSVIWTADERHFMTHIYG